MRSLFWFNAIFFCSLLPMQSLWWLESPSHLLLIQCIVLHLKQSFLILSNAIYLFYVVASAKFQGTTRASHYLSPVTDLFVKLLSFLSGELFNTSPFFVFWMILGLLCERRERYFTTEFDRKLPDVLFLYLCPNFWVIHCEIALKGSLWMMF